jgi:hypothetical protein
LVTRKNKLRYILTSALTGYTFKLGIAILLTPNLSGSLHDQNYLASERMIITDKPRCGWCHSSDLYMKYHDEEWGSVYDDTTLFEFYSLKPFKRA